MEIFCWLCVIVVGLCSLSLAVYMVRALLLLVKRVKKSQKKNIKQNIIQIIIALVFLAVFLLIINIAVNYLRTLYQYSVISDPDSKSSDLYNAEYPATMGTLSFHDEATNIEETIWDHLIGDELCYGRYRKWKEEADDFDALRSKYLVEFYGLQKLPFFKSEELSEHVNMFYGSYILPATDKTLNDIDAELENNSNIELYQNEFWLRAKKCSEDSSGEQFYYAAVAADNVFKGLCNGRNPMLKQIVFYGSMAVAFYLASVEHYEEKLDLILIYYRISEIYIYLERYVDFEEDDAEYSEHFLLMTEVFLMLAETEYEKQMKNGDIHEHKNITYFGDYYAEILYTFIVKYKSRDEKLVSMCRAYAVRYLNSPFTKSYTGGRKSCEDILIRLDKMGAGD